MGKEGAYDVGYIWLTANTRAQTTPEAAQTSDTGSTCLNRCRCCGVPVSTRDTTVTDDTAVAWLLTQKGAPDTLTEKNDA